MSKVTEIHKSLVPEIGRYHILQEHMKEIQKTLKEVEKGCSLPTNKRRTFLSPKDITPPTEVTYYLENNYLSLAIQDFNIGHKLESEQRKREKDYYTSVHVLRQQS
jgi:hypothetical protein